ncbi:RNA-guided endonuclease TnpB family protein [Pleurocapsa sp. PCC 7319]|uniref:RNA-guided endonuclease InsQ/TnpB family protein n=1 Tax=Pleurocapsa sp. PCC 7319 TaxID=118161 RepID=UPI000477115D|nr:RNA-guided endonuclease TnpB family protein [Pleurocapsa sp. PCC 7319]
MITYAYRYKIKPTPNQIRQFEQYLSICRSVYNFAHSERKAWIESRKCQVDRCSINSEYIIPAEKPFPNYNIQAKALTEAKKKLPHLKLVNAQCLQQVLKRLDRAWIDFFKMPSRGFPRFRNANRYRSFKFPKPNTVCLDAGRVKLPSIGWIKIRQSRPYPVGFTPKQLQIVRKSSGYYLVIYFESSESVPDAVPGDKSIGLDAGIESFVATPTQLIKSPRFLNHKARKLKLLQRRLKHKTKGSNNWKKLQNKIARLHEKVANTRRDWHFKLAHQVTQNIDNIFVEDIDFKSWSKGLFCKQSLDSGIGGFINTVLPYVASKQGKFYLKVDKNGTSQECCKCHAYTGKKELGQRIHVCTNPACLHTESRDTCSAKVIQHRGELAVGHTVKQGKTVKNACGGDATGIVQLSLFNLVGSR